MDQTAIAPVPVAGPAQITSLAEAARDYAAAGMAANTRRAYGTDLADFASWCASVGATPVPAEAATVALYLTARARHLAASTLARRRAAINAAHKARGLPPPASPELTAVWSGIVRTHGRPPNKKRGLQAEELKKVNRRLPGGLSGVRDRALLLVGYAGALRREELAQLSEDPDANVRAVFVAEGLEIHIGRSKGDQEGRGAVVAIPFGGAACPVEALRAWLHLSGIQAGPVFRSVDRHDRIGDQALAGWSIARIVKQACNAAGLPPAAFSGHSLRRGRITTAARLGAAPEELMRFARHQKFDTTLGYIEDASRFRNSAARKSGL